MTPEELEKAVAALSNRERASYRSAVYNMPDLKPEWALRYARGELPRDRFLPSEAFER